MNSILANPPVAPSLKPAGNQRAAEYNLPMGRLRAFVTALVVAHHAVLAYFPWAPPPPASLDTPLRWWQAFPVVDAQRWIGWALFVGWNDAFFMALMFFLSGLFVWSSLRRKGGGGFALHRLLRLGVPFVFAAGILAPLAYYPAYLQTPADHHNLASFWSQWRALGTWPAGPAWFIWVLLAFGCIAAALYKVAPHWAESANRVASPLLRRPASFALILILISGVAYVPLAARFGPLDWKAWGPFVFQTSRIILYAVYFATGIIVGASPARHLFGVQPLLVAQTSKPSPTLGQPFCCSDSVSPTSKSAGASNRQAHQNSPATAGLETCDTADLEVCATYSADQTLLAPDGRLAKRWIVWCVASLAAFIAATAISIAATTSILAPKLIGVLAWVAMPVSCAASSLALMAVFARFAKRCRPILKSFGAAAYGVYLVHYPVVIWTQYALLPSRQPAVIKGVVVTVAGILLSWGLVALARRWRPVARLI